MYRSTAPPLHLRLRRNWGTGRKKIVVANGPECLLLITSSMYNKRVVPMRSQQHGYLKHGMHKENTSWYANGGGWNFTRHTHILKQEVMNLKGNGETEHDLE